MIGPSGTHILLVRAPHPIFLLTCGIAKKLRVYRIKDLLSHCGGIDIALWFSPFGLALGSGDAARRNTAGQSQQAVRNVLRRCLGSWLPHLRLQCDEHILINAEMCQPVRSHADTP